MAARDRWREHVEQWISSGLTAAEYCDRAGVNPRTLSYLEVALGSGVAREYDVDLRCNFC